MREYRFLLRRQPTAEEAATLHAISGVRIRGGMILAPQNAAFLVAPIAASIGAHVEGPLPIAVTRGAIREIPELREWVPEFLLDYQREGILFAAQLDGAMCLWPPGSGKSLAGIVWALLEPGPILYITRAAARRTIANEVARYTTIQPAMLGGKVREIPPGARFVIVSWESLPTFFDAIKAFRPASVIFDEIHKGKSHKRVQCVITAGADGVERKAFVDRENISSTAAKIARLAKRRLGTTGTPVRDRVRDLWAQLDLLEPGAWGPFWTWAKRYADAHEGDFGWVSHGTSNEDELAARLQLVRHQVSHATTHRDLPPKRRQVTYLPVEEQNAPSAFARELASAEKRGGASLAEVKLAQAASRKRTYIVGLVEDACAAGQKVIVFTGRRKDCDTLGEAIKKTCKGAVVWVGHGDHTTTARDVMREEFMSSPGPCVLVGTGEAWGESVSLHDADLLVIAMLPLTPGQLTQWEGRVTRHGQKRPVLVVYVVAEHTADEHVAGLLLAKLPAVERVVGDAEIAQAGKDLRGDEAALQERLVSKILEYEEGAEP